jgi:hypothetical protein
MSFTDLLVHNVRVFNPLPENLVTGPFTVFGDYDEDAVSSAGSTSATIKARVEQIKDAEQLGGRDTRLTWFKIFLPAGTSVTALSLVYWDDTARTFQVDGEPWLVDGKTGPHHVEVVAREVKG